MRNKDQESGQPAVKEECEKLEGNVTMPSKSQVKITFSLEICKQVNYQLIRQDLCKAQETLLNVIWQPGWEGNLGENGYMSMYG